MEVSGSNILLKTNLNIVTLNHIQKYSLKNTSDSLKLIRSLTQMEWNRGRQYKGKSSSVRITAVPMNNLWLKTYTSTSFDSFGSLMKVELNFIILIAVF